MSFDRLEHAATGTPDRVPSQRSAFLDVLGMELQRHYGLRSDVVVQVGVMVLGVVDGTTGRTAEVSCDMTPDGWRYSWADSGRTITAVEDRRDAADVVARHLRGDFAGLS
ncbi:MAG: hypothetical protein JWN52_5081 [Actinomycetia bacterium]|nr:hypothetical protein [Actinomycetes bacterium]